MRARNVKPGFFKNEQLAQCQPLARILFVGLWCLADREGRLEDRPMRIKVEVLPFDTADVDGLLRQLEGVGLIVRYAVNGARYIAVPAFTKHQNCHIKEAPSVIPCQCEHHASTVQAPDEHQTGTVLTPDEHRASPAESLLLNPESLLLNPDKRQDKASRKRSAVSFDPRAVELPGWMPREAWVEWCDDRKARKKPMTEAAVRKQLAQLGALVAEGHAPAEVLAQSIAAGWSGLFAVKRANGVASEPEWRRRQRERNEEFLGVAAYRGKPKQEFIDAESTSATPKLG